MTTFSRQEAVIHAVASARLEGIELEPRTLETMHQWSNGEISSQELDQWLQHELLTAKALAVLDRLPPVEPEGWDRLPEE